ncbi:hypothetical protein Bcop_2395 [Bacteroides coprosuis DSM 18011]|uniref:Coenzyme PQQ synthesis D n=1 Tax=Bacteroides coprosuis DSM 18011 TaxID=679937 RepID=F3ZNL2_9BACE|nr:PqqD family peptide modification chaperone [Bacteroides coprosuis]EGJ72547.1 hypothetical protein Bcop_2395 [Bacteroides coprosuis DSM 18011]
MFGKSNNKINILDVTPIRRSHISTYIMDDGRVRLGILRFKSKWVNKYFLPKKISPEIKVPLDVHGSEVWKLIDGNRTIRKIIIQLATHFENQVDYEERIVTYLYQLKKDQLIDFLSAR